uniref:Uncharacterized protein n=1 Tax=Acrobeloides nanus TaxID=290746 RepID=A0A914DRQ1_9BILA
MVQGNIEHKETCHKLIDDTIEKFGRIDILVNNAGIAGKQGEKDPLSIENYEYTFDVNLKSPGGTETDFQSKIAPNGKEMVSQWAKKNVPMGRMGTSQEMAKAIVFIATEATYMTGSTIVIDGGVLHSNDFKVQD